MYSFFYLIYKGKSYLVKYGVYSTLVKTILFFKQRIHFRFFNNKLILSNEELELQKEDLFKYVPLISVVVPLYNTPQSYLREMLESVCAQSYANWQLCLADGSDNINQVEEIIRQYIERYPGKIKYRKLKENKGISENTNACIEIADGDYIALLDHDDILAPNALYEAVKVINEHNADFIYTDEAIFTKKISKIKAAHLKPDFAIDNLRSNNYICHLTVFKKSLLGKVGLFRKEYDGSQDHDMILRLTEVAEQIIHIPKVLYYWRAYDKSAAGDINSKPYAIEAGRKAVSDHLRRQGVKAIVESLKEFPTIYRIKYDLIEKPLISIIIPNGNSLNELKLCLESIYKKSTYSNFEIIIINIGTPDTKPASYYEEVKKRPDTKVVHWQYPFNYPSAYNYGAGFAKGLYLLFLHSDTKLISPEWMEEMLMYAQRPDVGAVGAKLYYANNTVQHAGIILGSGKEHIVAYAHRKSFRSDSGYMGRLLYAQETSAVTAACMMVKKTLHYKMRGFDEGFSASYYDVDFCLRLREAGYLVVFTPYAELYHYDKILRVKGSVYENNSEQIQLFKERWANKLESGDPYHNPNLNYNGVIRFI